MPNVTHLIEGVFNKVRFGDNRKIDLYTLEPTAERLITTHSLGLARPGPERDKFVVGIVDNSNNQIVHELRAGRILGFVRMLDNLGHAKTQYGKVSDSHIFRSLYNFANRQLPAFVNGMETTQAVDSGPCMMCGFIYPWDKLTIDHQRPQKGGENEAVLKALRHCGLTEEGPKGHKGRALLQHLQSGVPLTPVPPKPGRAITFAGNLEKRYTLTTEGQAIYSLLRSENRVEDLKSLAMHGLTNLAPLCSNCNSKRGNPLKFT